MEFENYDLQVIQEIQNRNNSIRELQEDIENLAEISQILSQMVKEQGENINVVEETMEVVSVNIQETVESLKQSEKYMTAARSGIRNTILVLGGVGLGALGFIAGPIVGVATTISGVAAGLGAVFIAEKKGNQWKTAH